MNFKIAAVALLALSVVVACNASDDSENVVKLTVDTYDEAINDGKVYFIKYFAPWCGHCKRLAPTWNELAGELNTSDSIVIAHVDCTTQKEICDREEVRGYPTLYAVQNGEKIEKYQGSREKAALKSFIEGKAKAS